MNDTNKSMEMKYEIAAEKLKSLAHPKRLEILAHLVSMGNCNVTALQNVTNMPQPTLSQHLARMQRSGVLSRNKKGTVVYYSLTDDNMVEAIKLLCDLDLHSSSNG